jgi:plastocyanin
MNSTLTPQRRLPVVRWLVAGGGLLLALVLIALFVSPPGRRLLARPTASMPAIGISEIAVRGDPNQNHLYDPPVVQVPLGTTITWDFVDYGPNGGEPAVPHDVVFSNLRSPIVTTGQWSHTFTEPGSYTYYCSLHSFMEGRIDVVAP